MRRTVSKQIKSISVTRTTPVPPKLGKLIELANSILPNVDLPQWDPFRVADAVAEKSSNGSVQLDEVAQIGFQLFRVIPRKLLRPIQKFIGPVNSDMLDGRLKMYEFLRDARDCLR